MSDASRYLLVVYRAQRRDGAPVPTGHVADAVGRSPAATTEMLQRLDERGLVAHEPYEGVALTPDGEDAAADLQESYRTLSRFFEEVLGLDDHDEEAMRVAGTVSPAVAERLAATLLSEDGT
ncbi:metal-dependent transcriptional regulator [Halorarius halobius]|uniref:metal-dependent transcriptional regulator n=1 Tax=Halorarius halobius TaxID=2962671 RepID=UPI0020CEA965|nr:metal-dependent transcriptional regulator [Halorarius halobius]